MSSPSTQTIAPSAPPPAIPEHERQALLEQKAMLCRVLTALSLSRLELDLRIKASVPVATVNGAYSNDAGGHVDLAPDIAVPGSAEGFETFGQFTAAVCAFIPAYLAGHADPFLISGELTLYAGGHLGQPVDWMAKFAEEKRQRLADIGPHKAALIAFLKEKSIHHVTARYDGEGDSGQIDSITAYNLDNREMPLTGTIAFGGEEPEPLEQALDGFFWECLTACHDGFEINEGGYGELSIDVANGKVTIDHNARFTDITNTVSEV